MTDPYVYPGSDVLRNNLDIHDAARLREAEANITAVRIAALAVNPLAGDYGLDHLQAFHRWIFGSLYDWAGELRTVFIAKAQMFAPPENIALYLGGELARLASENYLRGLGRAQFVERTAYYLGEVNAVHPFREGNGRTQRAFFSQLAQDAGYHIAWSDFDQQRNDAAFIASTTDLGPLTALLDDLITELSPDED